MSEKAYKALKAIGGELVKGMKKVILFNSDAEFMLENEFFTDFDLGVKFLEIETVLKSTAEQIEKIRKEFEK